ncbi:hypothetical protein AVEN_12459-1 [Araneus ventricosus]|uniref:Endonuclease/exonuclease/phosphatase domain-containing protein n=1 Tax=Araneus ventricosus TaxID=182803 RepID=A0A4Y2SY93_ARAVE|nr:hypothetical protein AVEN_12459-1 [Araneus ventricosus]
MASESEIIEGLSKQGVIAARRINIIRGNDIIPTKHVILTFSSSKLPSSITAGYIRSPVKPYIPNPLRCFNCQRFGHSKLLVEANLHAQIAELPVIQQMVNCHGFRNKSSELKDIINSYKPACIALQETYIRDNDTVKIRDYSIFSNTSSSTRASGGVALAVANDIPSSCLHLHTNLQAVAVRMHIKSLITICSLYLPPHQTVHQTELNNLISQLPSPFLILGDLNGHSPLWGGTETNSRGRQIEQLLADHNICLLNNNEKTHFHLPTYTLHSIDLALCTPALLPFLNLTVDDNLHNSDHFPLIITDNRHNSANHYYSQKYVYNAADWQKFSSLADITSAIIDNHTVGEALENIISIIKTAADASIPLAKGTRRRQYKPWWNDLCQQAYKAQQKAWNTFRRYPTTANLIKFKKSKADSRRIQRQSQRLSWRKYISTITSSTSSKELWQEVKKACGNVPFHSILTLTHNDQTISSPKEIADTIASSLAQISSSRNYPDHFLAHNLKEKTKLNFNTQSDLPYNNSFTLLEFQSYLSTVCNSSPGPDNVGYILIKHLTIESQKNILRLYNRIWQEQTFPTLWHQAIIIPILKPGKDATNPLNYRPIALTCCLCTLLERLVNRRLVHYLETNNIIHPHQSGFRKGRCTLDNLLNLKTDMSCFSSEKTPSCHLL